MKHHEPALVILEACGSAHYWAEMLGDMGHDVKLIASEYVNHLLNVRRMMQRTLGDCCGGAAA
jgi:transposase